MDGETAATLILSDENDYEIELADQVRKAGSAGEPRVTFSLSRHALPQGRPALIVWGGARGVFPPLRLEEDSRLWVCFGAGQPEIGPDGLNLFVEFRAEGEGPVTRLLEAHLSRFDSEHPWREELVDLTPIGGQRGQLVVGCDSGAESDHRGDCLALYELVVSPAATLTLNRARAFPEYRTANELAVNTATYDHPLYGRRPASAVRHLLRAARGWGGRLKRSIGRKQLVGSWARARAHLRRRRAQGKPTASEEPAVTPAPTTDGATPPEAPLDLHLYGPELMRRLELCDIDFRARLIRRLETSPASPIHILSLASGAARIEEMFIEGLDPERIELTLTDLNPDLLRMARQRLSDKAIIDCRVLNLNELELPEHSFDIVMCVSALHHVVELEQLTDSIANALVEDGELWSIGEYIGRNGARLFDDAYEVANEFFSRLPAKYRVDRNPGSDRHVDEKLPNADCSITCFEGIRSEEIESVLDRRFVPVESLRFDCFTWRLFNLAYLDNYDLEDPADRAIVERALQLEVDFYRAGGRPTALWGVFRRR